jgi:hypothetical protein
MGEVIQFPDPENAPNIPRNVEAVLGLLIMNLSNASHDTGKAYYLDIYPMDPARPDIYTADFSESTPPEAA